MQKILALSALFLAPLAHADYANDVPQKAIVCELANGDTVAINAERSQIGIDFAGQGGFRIKTNFQVTKRESDGDTFATYFASSLSLTFSDLGDVLELENGAQTRVTCRTK